MVDFGMPTRSGAGTGATIGDRLVSAVTASVTSRSAPAYSRLYLVGDGASWVLDQEARALAEVAQRLGISAAPVVRGGHKFIRQQVVHLTSQFDLGVLNRGFLANNRVAVSYFHGRPHPDFPDFESCLASLLRVQEALFAIHVSCRSMQDFLASEGVDPGKIHRIPIGVDTDLFYLRGADERERTRRALGIPASAQVIGSYQKDGVGWGEGRVPKLIKGPDVLLDVAERLHRTVGNLWFVLSGPARGYVTEGLLHLGIPFVHRLASDAHEVGSLYSAADVTLVTSRDEGGPKAVLESMASGTPVVSTRVGQAVDLIDHARNGWLADIGDATQLAEYCREALGASADRRGSMKMEGRETAEGNSYRRQDELWRSFWPIRRVAVAELIAHRT